MKASKISKYFFLPKRSSCLKNHTLLEMKRLSEKYITCASPRMVKYYVNESLALCKLEAEKYKLTFIFHLPFSKESFCVFQMTFSFASFFSHFFHSSSFLRSSPNNFCRRKKKKTKQKKKKSVVQGCHFCLLALLDCFTLYFVVWL